MKQMNDTVQVYQVLYDVSVTLPGFLVINRQNITTKRYAYLDSIKSVQHPGKDIVLDFGISKNSFRFSGITEDYLGITDLASKMIVAAVDTFNKGIELDNGHTFSPDLRASVDKTECFAPEGLILPSGLAQMFTADKVHFYSSSLPQVGRLGDILYAGNYNLKHDSDLDHIDNQK